MDIVSHPNPPTLTLLTEESSLNHPFEIWNIIHIFIQSSIELTN